MADPVPYASGGVKGKVGERLGITLPDAQPQVQMLRLTGLLFETDKAFLLPLAVPGMKAVADFFARKRGAQVLVSGHADTQGSKEYNRGLSVERADSVSAFLRDDADAWLDWYKGKAHSKPWGTREDQHMLSAVKSPAGSPYYQGTVHGILDAGTRAAAKAFQQDNGL